MPRTSPISLLRPDAGDPIVAYVAARLKKNLRNAASKSVDDSTSCHSTDCGNGRLDPVFLGNERIFSQLLLRIFLPHVIITDCDKKKPRGKCPRGCSTPSIQALDGGCKILPATTNAATIFA